MAKLHQRWIIHADMDAFYASVEQRDNPEFRQKPVIVGGSTNRGVVAACSYEARKYGVRSAMPIVQAKRLCPDGIYVQPDKEKYARISADIVAIFQSFSPVIETLALDEAFLDVTGMEMLYPDVTEIARQIKARVRAEVNLVVSVGVAPNKFLAKLASALQKPDGLVVIRPGEEIEVLAALPVTKLWGVGDVTARILQSLHIKTISDLRQFDLPMLERRLGKQAVELHNLAWGHDDRPVVPDGAAKSIGNENTFDRDISSPDEIKAELLALAENVGWRLRKAGLQGRTITLKIRFSSFRTITRSATLPEVVALDEVIYKTVIDMLRAVPLHEGIRLLGITVSKLGKPSIQMTLFDNPSEKEEKIAAVMDMLKERFGKNVVKRAGTLIKGERG